MKLYYGLKTASQIFNYTHQVCNVLGTGCFGTAPDQILETIAAETQMGTFPDTTTESGHGLTQFDQIGFDDTVARAQPKDIALVEQKFGYKLKELNVKDLDEDPKLSIIMCRLKYKLRPEPIPKDVVSRAAYWKRFYNSSEGKGTVEHYLESVERHLHKREQANENV